MGTMFKRFAAGFAATLLFHQLAVAALWAAAVIPRRPYSMDPVPPWEVPQVLSLAFWGGLWGVLLLGFVARLPARTRWPVGVVVGALATTMVAWYVVAPFKGRAAPSGINALAIGLTVNGAWAVGTLLIGRLLDRARAPR